jgi:DNA-binding NtrC family response regulator
VTFLIVVLRIAAPFAFTVVHLLTSDTLAVPERMDAYRRQLVVSALAETQGNRAAAARALGLHEKYLLRLLKSLRITE